MPWNSTGTKSCEIPGTRAQLGTEPGAFVAHLRDTRYSVRQQQRKTRAMERELGPIRFEWHSQDDAVLETLLSWKSQQYQRTGSVDVLSQPWASHLLHRLLRLDTERVRGQLSALYAGSELVAVHFGLRRGNRLHCWFPAYSVPHSRFSPGIELFLRMATQAPAEGVTSIDMGSGNEPYKRKLTNETYFVTRGSVDLVPLRSTLRGLAVAIRRQAKEIPWCRCCSQAVRQAMLALGKQSSL